MRLLLDTHIWLWSVSRQDRLSRNVVRALSRGSNELWLSPVSVFEFLTLSRKGKLRSPGCDPLAWVEEVLRTDPLRDAAYSREIALEAHRFELTHADPADRVIIATARVLGLTLATADTEIIAAGIVSVLANE